MEVDVYPKLRPELSPFLEGSLGELSLFPQTHGIWVDGVATTTATLPAGWSERLVPVSNENTGGAIGWCLDPHDLAFSKLAARREKDLTFIVALLRHKLVRPSQVEALIAATADESLRARLIEASAICRRRALDDSSAPTERFKKYHGRASVPEGHRKLAGGVSHRRKPTKGCAPEGRWKLALASPPAALRGGATR